jgi:hypothetical protein
VYTALYIPRTVYPRIASPAPLNCKKEYFTTIILRCNLPCTQHSFADVYHLLEVNTGPQSTIEFASCGSTMDPSRLQHPAKEHDARPLCFIGTLQPRNLVSTLGEVF